MRRIASMLAGIGILLTAPVALAQYPQKPVKLVVPYAPGGPPDVLGRLTAQKLGEEIGQSMFVENRPGAGGMIGAEAVAKAAPDGYTLLFGSIASLLITPALYQNVGYDPVTSFSPVSVIGVTSFVLVVSPKLPVKSVKDLIALAKSEPGKLNYGSSTLGTPPHIMAEMFKTQTGTNIFGINYKGSADAVTALLAGDVQVMFDQFAALLPLIGSGKARALMVTTDKRVKQLPDVRSAPEVGLPGLSVESWFGVLGPKGMAPEIVNKLHTGMVKAVASKDLIDALDKQGLEAKSSTPEEYLTRLKVDAPKWAAAVKASGAKVQ